MLKRFVTNTLWSTLALLMMSVIFTALAFFLIDNIEMIAGPLLMAIFCALLHIGYFIGQRLHYSKSLSPVSVVILPVLILAVVYGLSLVGIPFVSMMIQYPSAVWGEALNLPRPDEAPVLFYGVLIAHYLASALSLFIGAYKKHRENRGEKLK
ncbi:MAG: hypothetical protein IJB74_02630 [Clostridia bacterium]|nr:hypothetical protein [Clostridia bacterium]